MYQTELVVKGMYCGHCVMQLEGALDEIGAKKIDIDASSGKTSFLTDSQPDITAIVHAVRKYGFEPHGLYVKETSD